MKDTTLKTWGVIGIALTAIIASIMSIILKGWVLSILWGWFFVPLFGGPALKITSAIGINILFALILPTPNADPADAGKEMGERIGTIMGKALLAPLFILLMGWAVKGCM